MTIAVAMVSFCLSLASMGQGNSNYDPSRGELGAFGRCGEDMMSITYKALSRRWRRGVIASASGFSLRSDSVLRCAWTGSEEDLRAWLM